MFTTPMKGDNGHEEGENINELNKPKHLIQS